MALLTGKTILITGGGSGMGLASAKLLLPEGGNLALTGRDAKKLQEAAKSLAGETKILTHAADVSDPEQAKAAVEAVVKKFGKIDILINNAGINMKERTFRELTPESWQKVIRTNLDGAFYCI